jgi:hypothetical protein
MPTLNCCGEQFDVTPEVASEIASAFVVRAKGGNPGWVNFEDTQGQPWSVFVTPAASAVFQGAVDMTPATFAPQRIR